MIFTGISCSEEIFRIRKTHISRLADLLPLLSLASSCIAFSAGGVAAHPSPTIFAMMFVHIYSYAGCSGESLGNKNLMTGDIFDDHFFIRPVRSAIFIIPHHIVTIPSMVIQSETASLPASMIPAFTSSICPVRSAVIIPTKIMAAQIRLIIEAPLILLLHNEYMQRAKYNMSHFHIFPIKYREMNNM